MAADRPSPAKHSERIDGPTPAGGHHAVAHFSDEGGRPCPKEHAHRVEIVEHDEHDEPIRRTYGSMHPGEAKS